MGRRRNIETAREPDTQVVFFGAVRMHNNKATVFLNEVANSAKAAFTLAERMNKTDKSLRDNCPLSHVGRFVATETNRIELPSLKGEPDER